MVSLRFGWTAALVVLSVLGSTWALPLAEKLRSLSPAARGVLRRSTPAAPHFVAYDDAWGYLPPPSELRGFTVFAFSFLLTSGPTDQAEDWQRLSASQRAAYLQEYNSAGISLIVSAFGSTQAPTTSGAGAVATADTMAAWVIEHNLNGIDVDYEDFKAFSGGGGIAEAWLITFTQQLRSRLPQGQYIISHAPLAPWFSPQMWSGGGYLAVHEKVGSLIDWYNIQFYNQGASEYTTCSNLLDASSEVFPQTAVFEIARNGVDLSKLVIQKPAAPQDAKNGYMDPSMLASCVSNAASRGWEGGVGGWKCPHTSSAWITQVRGNTWPVSGGS